MGHTPFEEWLLSEEERSPEEKQGLADHLKTCAHCRKLAESWFAVRNQLQQAPLELPTPGFTRRFQARLSQRQASIQRRNAWTIFLIFLLVGISLGIYMAYQQAGGFPSALELLVGLAQSVALSIKTINNASHFFVALGRTLPIPIAIGLWIAFMTSMAFWIILWVVMVWRLPHRKRSTYET